MAVVRRNILTDAAARDGFVRGVKLLKQEPSGTTTTALGIGGPAKPVSTYDLLVVWHHWSMSLFTPAGQGDRNAAHSGPVFLPWHRQMLIRLEAQLQRVLGDPAFGLPYWDWAADGDKIKDDQAKSPLWSASCMGGNGAGAKGEVATGPFAAAAGWHVEVALDSNGALRSVSRGLRRAFDVPRGLPTRAEVAGALGRTAYDAAPWNSASVGFRNRLEGWAPQAAAPGLHNRVHVWVGGDMLVGSSPNDPVFYLNHCNVDRIWAAWQKQGHATAYGPKQNAPQSLLRHRIDDAMYSIFAKSTNGQTPRQMLNVSSVYAYDSLTVS